MIVIHKDKCIAWLEKQIKVKEAMRDVEQKAKAFTETHAGQTSDEILAQMRGYGSQVKEPLISQHEIETCKENDNSLTSEDERIRKEIITFIVTTPKERNNHKKWIAWLEKQGEQFAHTEISKKSGHFNKEWPVQNEIGLQKVIKAIEEGSPYILTFRDGYYMDAGNDEESQMVIRTLKKKLSTKEAMYNKPAWSEEDEKILEIIISVLRVNFKPKERFSGYEEYTNADLINCLKSIKNRVPQPKQEWSEEDENGLGDALWAIQQAGTIAKDENDTGNLWYAEHWLKSLKDRYTWKPTEEQISVLEYHLNTTCNESWQYAATKQLLNDLNKL